VTVRRGSHSPPPGTPGRTVWIVELDTVSSGPRTGGHPGRGRGVGGARGHETGRYD